MASKVCSEVAGTVWQLIAAAGSRVEQGETVMLIESMKMEIPVLAPRAGTLASILLVKGDRVDEGQTVAFLE